MISFFKKNPEYRAAAGLTFTYFILFIVTLFFEDYIPLSSAYIWNIFLSLIPMLLSLIMQKMADKEKNGEFSLAIFLIGLLWLIMFPNAPYMFTDLAHLNLFEVSYGLNISTFRSAWFGLLFAAFSIMTGVLMGMLSLYITSSIIKKKYNSFVSWIFVTLVSILSGLGMYLGRFPRFNSWDIFRRPLYLIKTMLSVINLHTFGFVVLFSITTGAAYWLFYLLFDHEKIDKIKESEDK